MKHARNAFAGRTILAVGVSIAALAAASPAYASCNQTGSDIDCTGNTTAPVFITQDGVTVTIEATATVDGQATGSAINIAGDDNVIVNQGTLDSSATNGATLQSQSFAGVYTFMNSGTVRASGSGQTRAVDARVFNSDALITNDANGVIETSGRGIYGFVFDGTLTVTNEGRIAHLANSQFQGSSLSAGIALNAGNFNSAGLTSTLVVTNTGTIDTSAVSFADGIYATTFFGSQTIRNDGQIIGFDGIEARYGNASTNITNTGTISAQSQGITVRRVRSDAAGSPASSVFVNNSGTVTANRAGGGTGVSIIDLDGVNLALVNTGSIEAATRAVVVNSIGSTLGASIENSGQIIANEREAVIVQMDGASVSINNTGLIEAQTAGEFAIRIVDAQAQVLNSGDLIGNVDLGAFDDSFTMLDGSLDGSIDGGNGADSFIFDLVGQYVHDDLVADFETVTINGDVVIDGGTISGADLVTLTAGSQLSLGGTNGGVQSTIDAAQFVNQGTLTLDPGFSLLAGDEFMAADGSITRFVIDDPGQSAPQLLANLDVTFASGSVIEVDARDQNLLANGQMFDAVIAGGTITDLSGDIVDNSMLFDFTKLVVHTAQGDALQITVQQVLQLPDAVTAGDGNALSVATALQDVIDSGTPTGNQIATVLGQIGDSGVLAGAIDSFGPGEANAVLISLIDSTELQFGAVSSRSDSARNPALSLWGNLYASSGSLDAADALGGFESDRAGFVAGMDVGLSSGSGTRIGVAFSAADGSSDAIGNRAVSRDQSEQSLFAYVVKPDGTLRFQVSLGLGWGSVESSRAITALGEAAIADFDTSSTFGRFEIGRAFESANRALMPYVAVQFVDASHDGYAEAGSVAALEIGERSATSVRGDLGIAASFGAPSAAVSFTGRLALTNEFGNLDSDLDARFVAGGPGFVTQVQNRDGLGGLARAKLHIRSGKNVSFALGYEGQISGGAELHAVRGEVAITF